MDAADFNSNQQGVKRLKRIKHSPLIYYYVSSSWVFVVSMASVLETLHGFVVEPFALWISLIMRKDDHDPREINEHSLSVHQHAIFVNISNFNTDGNSAASHRNPVACSGGTERFKKLMAEVACYAKCCKPP